MPKRRLFPEEDGELPRGGGHGLGFAGATGEAAVESTERGLGPADVDGGHAQERDGPVGKRRVFELRTRPPVILLPGARHSHEVKQS